MGERACPWYEGRTFPPVAFATPWEGTELHLPPDLLVWLRDRCAFGWIGEYFDVTLSGCPWGTYLFVCDMRPRTQPRSLVHATPVGQVERILTEGLRPGRLTGVQTTRRAPHSRLWVHLFETVDHARDCWLLAPCNRERIPPGEYAVLRVDPSGVTELLCDPFLDVAFVTESCIPPEFIHDGGTRIVVPIVK